MRELARRVRRIHTLGERAEPDAPLAELLNPSDEVFERAAEAVELPDDERVASASEGERLGQAWTLGLRAAGLVGEGPLAPGPEEGIELDDEPARTEQAPVGSSV